MTGEKILDISWKTILKIGLAILSIYIIYSVKDILVWLIFAVIISLLFNPAIDFLQRRRIPRVLATLAVYFVIFGFFSVLIISIIPIFSAEIKQFANSFSDYYQKVSPFLQQLGIPVFNNAQAAIQSLQGTLDSMSESVFDVLVTVFGGIFSTLFVITTAIFLSLEEKAVEKTLVLIFPKKYEAQVLNIWERSQRKVSGWFGARIIGCLFVGIVSYVIFLMFNVRYPGIMALFAGVLSFVPYVGPVIAGILISLLVFPVDILKGIFVLAAFIIIQEIEGKIISPILMKRFMNLSPVLVLISLVVGARLWGFLGALLVVPLAGIVFDFTKEFLQKRRERESSA